MRNPRANLGDRATLNKLTRKSFFFFALTNTEPRPSAHSPFFPAHACVAHAQVYVLRLFVCVGSCFVPTRGKGPHSLPAKQGDNSGSARLFDFPKQSTALKAQVPSSAEPRGHCGMGFRKQAAVSRAYCRCFFRHPRRRLSRDDVVSPCACPLVMFQCRLLLKEGIVELSAPVLLPWLIPRLSQNHSWRH